MIFIPFLLSAKIKPEKYNQLKLYEDTLQELSDSITLGTIHVVRQQSCFEFIKILVKALKIEDSYDYPFDSLKRIAIIKAPDKKFRMFNWGLQLFDGTYRYYGAVQLNNSKKLTVFPLFDYSYKILNIDTLTNYDKWYGCLYYNILQKGKYYYLFGWDGNNLRSNKKIIDVLWFNKNKEPMFGSPKFIFKEGDQVTKTLNRFIIEYKKFSAVTLNYDIDLKLISYDHLVPPNETSKDFLFTYIPDGSYEGFVFQKKKWVHVDQVFNSTMEKPVFPKPLDFDEQNSEFQKNKKQIEDSREKRKKKSIKP